MASKRVAEWPEKDQAWLDALSPSEREVVLLLAAHLDARPIEDDDKETK